LVLAVAGEQIADTGFAIDAASVAAMTAVLAQQFGSIVESAAAGSDVDQGKHSLLSPANGSLFAFTLWLWCSVQRSHLISGLC
jgi:hypothetical protein